MGLPRDWGSSSHNGFGAEIGIEEQSEAGAELPLRTGAWRSVGGGTVDDDPELSSGTHAGPKICLLEALPYLKTSSTPSPSTLCHAPPFKWSRDSCST
jgi:hypothetical protein